MASTSIRLTDATYEYLIATSLREPPVLARLREATAEVPGARMQISPEQGQFMGLLVELTGAERALEVGTYTGYSALAVALALPPEGRLVACDVSEEYTAVARRFWAEAGVSDKIQLYLAPAAETLRRLVSEGAGDTFDFMFIDADKESYDTYYELGLRLVRPGGLIAIDNVLWHGAVADPRQQDADTVAIRALNAKLLEDQRVSLSLIPIGDGLTLARRR